MRPVAEALQAILFEPLDYLHPLRGQLPTLFDVPQARALLNQALLRELKLNSPHPDELGRTPWSDLWVRHWQSLPLIARLMGAQLSWPALALGARLRDLEPVVRAFARVDLGHRACSPQLQSCLGEESLEALGLNVLMAWKGQVPESLMQRLPLQFSPSVVALQQRLPAQQPLSSLFALAVQHARIHQNPR